MRHPHESSNRRAASRLSSTDSGISDTAAAKERSAGTVSFGSALRAARLRCKLSVGQLASLIDMSASYVSRLEHDHVPPSEKITHRLAIALNTDVGTLQIAAGRLPEFVVEAVRNHPGILTLLNLMAKLPDNEIIIVCEELLRRSEQLNTRYVQ